MRYFSARRIAPQLSHFERRGEQLSIVILTLVLEGENDDAMAC